MTVTLITRISNLLLQLERVTKSFNGLMAVNYVSMNVGEGEIIGLIGPNGAGKTTLFNLITGFYPPNNGKVLFEGKDITAMARHERCWLGIARTFQLARPFPQLSVLDNVAIGRVYGYHSTKNRAQAESDALEILEQIGLATRAAGESPKPSHWGIASGSNLPAHWRPDPNCFYWMNCWPG